MHDWDNQDVFVLFLFFVLIATFSFLIIVEEKRKIAKTSLEIRK
jgi:preprotein translocase subunit YajC